MQLINVGKNTRFSYSMEQQFDFSDEIVYTNTNKLDKINQSLHE